MAEYMIWWIGAKFGQSCHLLQLIFIQPFKCKLQEINFIKNGCLAHHCWSITMTMAGNYNNSIAITEPGICLFRNVCRSKQRRELALEWGADADKIVCILICGLSDFRFQKSEDIFWFLRNIHCDNTAC